MNGQRIVDAIVLGCMLAVVLPFFVYIFRKDSNDRRFKRPE